jgi:hypothetical protein
MPRGQPTIYDPKYCDEIIEYFSIAPYEERMKKVVTKQGDVVEIPFLDANDTPSFAGFAAKIGVDRTTIHNWCATHKEFFLAHKKAKELQENWLITNGNKGLVNTAFAIFMAKNVIGWRDRQELDSTNVNVETSSKELEESATQIKEALEKLNARK